MKRKILIIQGHPDPAGGRFCHALAESYGAGARDAGHEVRTIAVAGLDFPLLRTGRDWQSDAPPGAIRKAQDDIAWAEHMVLFYPLWLGGMPARLKGFLEQVLRPGFAVGEMKGKGWPKKLLKGRSARIVVTMGMPAFVYRHVFRAHTLKSLERNILRFCGIGPVRNSLIGMVESGAGHRVRWVRRMRQLGGKAA